MESFTILKVKSHSDNVPTDLKYGNDMADKYAGEAVREISSGDESRVRRLDWKTRLIQERMIQAIFLLPKRGRHPEEPSPEPLTIRALRIAAAKRLQHEVSRRGPYLECARCGQFWLSKHIDILDDLGPCMGHTIYGKPERDRPWVIPTGHKALRWGQQVLHKSHQAKWVRGVMYCTECGAYSTNGHTFKKLADVCKPNPKSQYAQQTRGLSQGKLRPGIKKWPCSHNYPGNKRITDYHYYPEPNWKNNDTDIDDPRGLTHTGRMAADKVRDPRLRKQLTGTTKRPTQAATVPQHEPQWNPPKWLLQALEASGDTHLLYEEPTVQGSRTQTEAETASSSTDAAPKAKRRKYSRKDTISDSQVIEAYVSDTLDTDSEAEPEAEEQDAGELEAQPNYEALLFSGIYRGHVTVGRYHYRQPYAIGMTDHGQGFVDLGADPNEDSSWFDEMLKPLETHDRPTHYPMQGSNWGLVR